MSCILVKNEIIFLLNFSTSQNTHYYTMLRSTFLSSSTPTRSRLRLTTYSLSCVTLVAPSDWSLEAPCWRSSSSLTSCWPWSWRASTDEWRTRVDRNRCVLHPWRQSYLLMTLSLVKFGIYVCATKRSAVAKDVKFVRDRARSVGLALDAPTL